MRRISTRLRNIINEDPYFQVCVRRIDKNCLGRIEIHHVFKYAGRQIDELWNFQPLCHYHHQGKGFDKDKSEYLALQRATVADLAKYPKKEWFTLIRYLKQKYDNRDSNRN